MISASISPSLSVDLSKPFSISSRYLLLALTLELAQRYILRSALGSTTVPISLPSITTFSLSASFLCSATSFSLTLFTALNLLASLPISSSLSLSLTSVPFKKTLCSPSTYFILISRSAKSLSILSSSLSFIPFSKKKSATALYIAPVSIYTKPSFLLRAFAIVDFPAPAGPSIAILYISRSFSCRISA